MTEYDTSTADIRSFQRFPRRIRSVLWFSLCERDLHKFKITSKLRYKFALLYHFCNAILTTFTQFWPPLPNPAYEPVNCVTVVNLGTARVWKYSAKQHKHINIKLKLQLAISMIVFHLLSYVSVFCYASTWAVVTRTLACSAQDVRQAWNDCWCACVELKGKCKT